MAWSTYQHSYNLIFAYFILFHTALDIEHIILVGFFNRYIITFPQAFERMLIVHRADGRLLGSY